MTFRALRHRNFQLFWSGQLISLIGTWMQNLAKQWLVFSLASQQFGKEHTALPLGIVTTVGSLPLLLFSLFGGVVADRLNKRRILIVTQSCAMMLAFVLAILVQLHVIQLWHVALLALLLGTVNAFDMPARQAFVKDMVGPEDLVNAIALNSSIFNGARIIGPAIAGILIAIHGIGISGAFYLNGISYLAVIAGLIGIRLAWQPTVSTTANVWEHLHEGFVYAKNHRAIRLILIVMAIFSLFGFSYTVLMPAIAGVVLRSNVRGLGILTTFSGAGALVGALALATFAGQIRKGKVLLFGGMTFSLALIAFSFSHHFLLSSLLLMFVTGGLVVSTASINSLIQETTPDALRGRVVSIWTFLFAGSAPLGALYAGTVAHFTSFTTPILIGGSVCLLTIIYLSLRAPWLWRLE